MTSGVVDLVGIEQTKEEDKFMCSKTLIWKRGGLFNSSSLVLACLWAVRPMCILSTLTGL